MSQKTYTEKFKVKGRRLVEKIDALARAGNVRRVIIKNKEGKEFVRFPMTLGVVAAVLAPVFVSIGVIAFFITESSLIIEKKK